MEFLYILENIRTPFLDTLISLITHLGDEPVFLALGLLIFWCIDKYEGYYLMSVGFFGTALNQILKITFRIPRPWIIDENFTIVESARARAGGYSFPSGHTQVSVGAFGGVARWNKNKILRALCILICIAVPFSRMYLGVHTPLDVSVGTTISLVLVFGFYPIMKKAKDNKKIIPAVLTIISVFLCMGLCYVHLWDFPHGTDAKNLVSAQKNLWTLLGAVLGVLAGYVVDIKYVNFETKASLTAQLLKFTSGVIAILLIKSALKPVLSAVFGEMPFKDAIRYFITVFTACGLWPMTFKWFSKNQKTAM